MSKEEEQQREETKSARREERYRDSQDDVSNIRKELHKLIAKTGDLDVKIEKLTTALTGNDLGTDGLVAQVRENVEQLMELSRRVENIERSAKLNQKYFMAFIGSIGVVLGTLIKIAIDRIFKK